MVADTAEDDTGPTGAQTGTLGARIAQDVATLGTVVREEHDAAGACAGLATETFPVGMGAARVTRVWATAGAVGAP